MDPEDHDHFKTIASRQAGQQQGLQTQRSEGSLALVRDPAYTLRKAQTICSLYRKDETHEPEVYVAAVAAVLSDYPKYIIDYVCDPRTGITGKSKWLPSVAEVRSACEQEINKKNDEIEREQRIARQLADRTADALAKNEKKITYDELKDKYGDGRGGWIGEGGKKNKLTQEEKENLLTDAVKIGKEISQMRLLNETIETIESIENSAGAGNLERT